MLSSFLLSFHLLLFIFFIFNIFLLFILITLFYFNLSFFLSFFLFFLPFLWSHVADSVFVLWLGVKPVSLRWESRAQDIGPPETSRIYIISNSKSSPRDLHLSAKTQVHSMTTKLQCCTPFAKQLERQEHNPTHQQRHCLKS